MTTAMRTATLVLLIIAGCRREAPAPPAEAPGPGAIGEPAAPRPEPPRREHGEPVVGGCLAACLRPGDAARGFLRALIGPHPAEAARFLDSRSYVEDGERLGDAWHALWRRGAIAARRNAIRGHLETLARRLGPLVWGLDAEALIRQGLVVVGGPPGVSAWHFSAPGQGAPWALKFHRRGTEWLLYALELAHE